MVLLTMQLNLHIIQIKHKETNFIQRINPVITQPGLGTLLFGDKTAFGYASAFDRINVRRLFLTVEQALEKAAQKPTLELNDEINSCKLCNIVEPYLRDVQAKSGLYGLPSNL